MIQGLPPVVTQNPGALGIFLAGASLAVHAIVAVIKFVKNGKARPSGEHASPGWVEAAQQVEGRLSSLETSREYANEELSGFRKDLGDFRTETKVEFAQLREKIERALSERFPRR